MGKIVVITDDLETDNSSLTARYPDTRIIIVDPEDFFLSRKDIIDRIRDNTGDIPDAIDNDSTTARILDEYAGIGGPTDVLDFASDDELAEKHFLREYGGDKIVAIIMSEDVWEDYFSNPPAYDNAPERGMIAEHIVDLHEDDEMDLLIIKATGIEGMLEKK